MVSKEEENFLRIVYLNYRVATGALTRFFDKLHPQLTADLHIPGNKAILNQLYNPPLGRRRVLFPNQWNILYPALGAPAVTSADLDLTLMVCLLRNLPPVVIGPMNGFNQLPNPNDNSDGANIARLKYYKNFQVSHSKDGTLSNVDFVSIWNTFHQAIKGLDNSQATIASLKDAKTKMLDSSMVQMLSTQSQLSTKVSRLQDELEKMTENIEDKMKITECNLEKNIKESDVNMHILYKRLNTNAEQTVERVMTIEKHLKELRNLQQLLASKFTNMETAVKKRKGEEDKFEKNVKLICSQIQDCGVKHKERIEALEKKYDVFFETLQELQKDVDSIKATTECTEAVIRQQDDDHIPKNIRAQHGQEIEEWEEDQTTFLLTRATYHILESLPLHNCIVVTGSSGSGKSANIHHAALHLRDSLGYEIIPVLTGPTDIINYYNEIKKQVFVVDDICGKETINKQTFQTWRDFSENIEKIFEIAKKDITTSNDGNVSKMSSKKLLISCRLHIYKEPQFQQFTLLIQNECNLSSSELCLLQEERMLMLHKYLPDDIIDNIKQVMENADYFPLLCKLSKDKTSEEVKKLFTAPLHSIKSTISNICNENKEQFCALVLCVLFDCGFNTDWLKLRSAPEKKKDKLEDIVKEFDINLSREIHRECLKSGFSTLNGTFLNQRGTEYRIIHDKIYKMTAVICGDHLTECFIKHAPSELIRNHFIFESLTEIDINNASIVLLKDQEEDYFERLLCDLKCDDITSTFHNNQLIHQSFVDKLISFFERSDDAKTVLQKLNTKGCILERYVDKAKYPIQTHCNTTPLIESASNGYIDIVHFLVEIVNCNVNKTDGVGRSPLFRASESGHLDVVKLLLENNAYVVQFNDCKNFPLNVACKNGYTDIVKLLLQNNADVFQCNGNSESSLFFACKAGHTNIVEVLLQYNALVNQFNDIGEFPLLVACTRGNTDTVKLLLKSNANVNLFNKIGESPLYWACIGGYTNIVDLLLQNNADVSQCCIRKQSPLYVACAEGHTDIVKLLLQKNANVSQYNELGQSPLYAACVGGHTDTVKLLLKNNANASHCNKLGESPLNLACARGNLYIIDLLLQNSADVLKCNGQGESPLYVACKKRDTNIVKLLLKNNANASQCNRLEKSPLYLACERGYTDIVDLLLQNNADVSQCCIRKQSPLYAACAEGHTDIVELLLHKNANVSQYNELGQSPLYAACVGGYRDTVTLLLKNNANANPCSVIGEYPLYLACNGGHIDLVKMLLQNNIFVSKWTVYLMSPLCVACALGHTYIVEMLLQYNLWDTQFDTTVESPSTSVCTEDNTVGRSPQKNADVSKCYSNRFSPLHVACKGGYTDIVELLLQNNADVSQCITYGWTPLHVACVAGHESTVQLLLKNNADVSQCTEAMESPLYMACAIGHTDIVTLLLYYNADVSQCEQDGQSPLHVACDFGSLICTVNQSMFNSFKKRHSRPIEIVKLLLASNADVRMCNQNGQTPLDIARKSQCKQIVELLEENLKQKESQLK